MPRYAPLVPRHPYRAAERTGGIIPIRSIHEPIQDVCFVAVDGDMLRAERKAAWIEGCSDLMVDYVGMEPLGVVAAVRRIANLAVVGFSTVGIALGFAAQVLL